MSAQQTWLNEKLADRLLKRIDRPGVAQPQMADGIATRLEQMALPQPLVDELADRWQSTLDLYGESTPLVLAQPIPPESTPSIQQATPRKPKAKVGSAKPLARSSVADASTPTIKQPDLPLGLSQSGPTKETSSSSSKLPRHNAKAAQSSIKMVAKPRSIQTQTGPPNRAEVNAQPPTRMSAMPSPTAPSDQASTLPIVRSEAVPDQPAGGGAKQPPNQPPLVAGKKTPSIPERPQSVVKQPKVTETAVTETAVTETAITENAAKRPVVKANSRSTVQPEMDSGNAAAKTVALPVVSPAPVVQSVSRFSQRTKPTSNPSVQTQHVARKSAQPTKTPKPAAEATRAVVTPASLPSITAAPGPSSSSLPVSVGKSMVGNRTASPPSIQGLPNMMSPVRQSVSRQPAGRQPVGSQPVGSQPHNKLPLATAKAVPSVQSQPASSPSKPNVTPARTSGPAASNGSSSNVIQRAPDPDAISRADTNASAASMSIEEIVEEVQRQFMRNVAIEGERRGATSWR